MRDCDALLLRDARGHGRGGKPHDPARCSRRHRAGDVLAVLDAEGIKRAAFWGHSLGGMVGFSLGHDHPERITALVLTGCHPFPMPPAEAAEAQGRIDGLRGGMESFVAGSEADHGPLPADVRAKWLANNHLALVASMEAWVADSDGSPAAELPHTPTPTRVFVGTEEPFYADVRRVAAVRPDAEMVPLPGFDHLQTYRRADAPLPGSLRFLPPGIKHPQLLMKTNVGDWLGRHRSGNSGSRRTSWLAGPGSPPRRSCGQVRADWQERATGRT